MRQFSIYVAGVPQPQGSKTPFAIRKGGAYTGKVAMVEGRRPEARANFKSWREGIAQQARAFVDNHNAACQTPWTPLEGPVLARIEFRLPRPASAAKRVTLPAKRPDLDKLTRAVFDALKGIAIVDDSQIVDMRVSKIFGPPGAVIHLEEMRAREAAS